MFKRILLLAALLLASPALAQEPPQTATPCKPVEQSVQLAGVDLDTLRCELLITTQTLGQRDMQIIELQANTALGEERLKAERLSKAKIAADYEARLDEAMKWLKAAQEKPAP